MFVKFYRLWGQVRRKVFTTLCRSEFYRIGCDSIIQPPIRIQGEKYIDIGNRVFIGGNSWLQVIPSELPLSGSVLILGDEVSVAGSCTISAVQSVVVEAKVLIAQNVYISDHNHGHKSRVIAIKDQGLAGVASVRICEGAWLGQGVVVCPGVTIGRNAVVGANSVVRHDVPDYCVAAGVPARIIRRVDEK